MCKDKAFLGFKLQVPRVQVINDPDLDHTTHMSNSSKRVSNITSFNSFSASFLAISTACRDVSSGKGMVQVVNLIQIFSPIHEIIHFRHK